MRFLHHIFICNHFFFRLFYLIEFVFSRATESGIEIEKGKKENCLYIQAKNVAIFAENLKFDEAVYTSTPKQTANRLCE